MRTTAVPVIVDGGLGTLVRLVGASTCGIAGADAIGRHAQGLRKGRCVVPTAIPGFDTSSCAELAG